MPFTMFAPSTDTVLMTTAVEGVLQRYGARREALVQILRDVQDQTRLLSRAVI